SQYNGETFTRIFYVDESTAFAIRGYQLYKTTDSAKTWTLMALTNDYVNWLTDIWFTDKQTGFVAGESGAIFTTHDAGATWQSQNPLINNYVGEPQINTIRFFNPRVGYIAGGNDLGPTNFGFIYKTIDSGRTWQQSYDHGGNAISFTPDSNVLITGFGGMLLKSPVSGWQINAVSSSYVDYPCTMQLSASAGVLYGEIDSLSFEVTSPDNKVQYIAASPGFVKDGNVTCTAPSDTAWIPGAAYTVRFRLFYKGAWAYSAPTTITAAGIPKPVITFSSSALWSSALSGNQWYLNGKPIAGAVDNGWSPRDTGSYTVQATQNGCTSKMSDPYRVSGSWKVDGPTVVLDAACVERFAAILETSRSEADSVSFQITAPGQTTTNLPATPDKVNNARLTVTASANSLAPGKTYTVRLRLWYSGAFKYSDGVDFTLPDIPAPVITDSAGQLSSSFTAGNQWYLDGSSIPGANDARFVPQRSGDYTVQSTQGACVSPMSQQVRMVVGNLGVVGYPNPVGSQLTLLNTQNRILLVEIVNMNGNAFYKARIEAYSTTIPARQLAAGQYIVHLVDQATGEKKSFTFVKL
ncbi:MAG TPA: T9SS type A sorting domain-containing protein, partial [Puia sp.]|nr:T9SS type A sorting domain-containing protein [Puia sp.]